MRHEPYLIVLRNNTLRHTDSAGHGGESDPVNFYRLRGKRRLTQSDTHGTLIELVFTELIVGALALGFSCHYGFDRLAAVD